MRRKSLLSATVSLSFVACAPVGATLCSRAHRADHEHEEANAVAMDATPGNEVVSPFPAPSTAPVGPLHVFATHRPESEEMPPGARMCPIHGVTWLCGDARILVVRDGAVERDQALEVGLPNNSGWIDGLVRDIVGHWPDDAWLMMTRADMPPPPETFAVYRWVGGRWRIHQPAKTLDHLAPSIASWGRGGALLAEESGLFGLQSGPRLRGLGARAGSLPNQQRVAHCQYGEDIGPIAAFEDGSLIAVHQPSCSMASVIQRWSSPFAMAGLERLPFEADGGAKSVIISGLEGDKPNDLIAFGYDVQGEKDEGNHAYLAHFDGRAWSVIAPPPDTRTVISYARDAAGTQWAIANPEEHGVLWRREAHGSWEPVSLPRKCEPSDISKTDDGALWVRCWRPIHRWSGHGFDLTLLSTVAPSRVVELAAHPTYDPAPLE
jgi:hypothetical protein